VSWTLFINDCSCIGRRDHVVVENLVESLRFIDLIDDDKDIMPGPTELPDRQQDPNYERPAIDGQNWVPALYGSNPPTADVEQS